MQIELIKALAGFFTAYYIVNVVVMHMKVKLKIQRRIKPFDCTICLTVWLTLALWFLPNEISTALACIFGAGFLATKIQ